MKFLGWGKHKRPLWLHDRSIDIEYKAQLEMCERMKGHELLSEMDARAAEMNEAPNPERAALLLAATMLVWVERGRAIYVHEYPPNDSYLDE